MTTDNKTLPVFRFARYVNGVRMAEGVTIEKANNLPDAMRTAAKLATIGHGGDVPVLVHEPATLADVQPGGRVRLGDQAELDRLEFQAWARELLPCPFCGNSAEFVPYKDNGLTLKCKSMGCIQRNQRTLRYGIDWLRTSMAEHWNTRALSAQPSPGGQGWPFVESPADFSERMVQALRKFDMLGAVRHVLIENPPVLAARQPVGQIPAEVLSAISGVAHIAKANVPSLADKHVAVIDAWLYAAPPAQTVDLGPDHRGMRVSCSGLLSQVRGGLKSNPELAEMVRQLHGHLNELGKRWYAGDRKVVDEFLQLYVIEDGARRALIDSQAVGNG